MGATSYGAVYVYHQITDNYKYYKIVQATSIYACQLQYNSTEPTSYAVPQHTENLVVGTQYTIPVYWESSVPLSEQVGNTQCGYSGLLFTVNGNGYHAMLMLYN